MRALVKLLLLSGLAACGAPDSDAVFANETAKADNKTADTTAAKAPTPTPRQPRYVTKAHGGYFRRVADDFQFQPCGTKVPLEIFFSPPHVGRQLRERARWNMVWEGVKMFAVFQGAIVTDTPSVADSVKPSPRTRFFFAGVDSMRAWRSSDCGGMQLR